jgi:hypothetical protein
MCPPSVFVPMKNICGYNLYRTLSFPPKFWCLCNVALFELLLLVLVMRQNFLCKHAFDLISPLNRLFFLVLCECFPSE